MKIKNKLKSSLKGLFGALVLSGLFLGSPMESFAGSPVETPAEEGWTLIAEKGDVKAYAQMANCGTDGNMVYLIKLENIDKDENLDVEYSIAVTNHPGMGLYKTSIKLGRGAVENGSCNSERASLLKIETFGDNPTLENLQLQILTVKTLEDEK